jgi:protein arginine N-methyltransferase 1
MAVDLNTLQGPDGYAVATESLPYLRGVFDAVGHPFDLRLCVAGPVREAGRSSPAAVESLVFGSAREAPAPDSSTSVDLRAAPPGGRVTGLVLWTRVAASSHTTEVDALTGATRGWAPVYVPVSLPGLPVGAGDLIRVRFTRRTSDDGVHPDYRVSVELAGVSRHWLGSHHGPGFRGSEFYRHLFPGPGDNSDARSGTPS